MKTALTILNTSLKAILVGFSTGLCFFANAQSGGSLNNGLKFENPVLQTPASTDLKVGAKYLFENVESNVDAIVTIDSLINGATINKIDDNSNGTGYKEAFQPAIQSGNVVGMSYAVFTIRFVKHGDTTISVILPVANATALDLDGNSNLKEFARINMGTGGVMNYMIATPDISVSQLNPGDFMGQNILGIERSGIDTSSLANMFTASNTNISSFKLKYGSVNSNPSSPVRQYSLYLKRFDYPGNVLPVKLLSFSAMLNNNNRVDLKWSTVTEINLNYFTVEKSLDGINFNDAGMVFAYGNQTDQTNYSLSDNVSSIQSGVVYYRLRSVDNDGKSQLSATRMIRIGKTNSNVISIMTYPNPVNNELRVTVPANWQNKKVMYEVITMNGQTAKRMESANSSQTEALNVSSLAPGVYFVRVSCEGQTAQQKIIKQ
ncbi:MAG: T9SS type A sorting domain-containing protein [Chitinophagaceae bacterium]